LPVDLYGDPGGDCRRGGGEAQRLELRAGEFGGGPAPHRPGVEKRKPPLVGEQGVGHRFGLAVIDGRPGGELLKQGTGRVGAVEAGPVCRHPVRSE
jgi:hypothetical protein